MNTMYIKKNKRSSAQHMRMRVYGVSAVLLVLPLAAWLVMNYAGGIGIRISIFPVKEVVFSGNRHLSPGELETISGIKQNEDLLMLSTKKTAEKMLLSPWIKKVSVRKDFPERLLINITEAVPFAILDKDGEMSLIDERGNLLEKMKTDPVPFLPIIHAGPADGNENFMEALSLARIIRDKEIATERTRVEILANGKGPEEMSLIVDNLLIKIGRGDYERKLNRLFAIEEEIKKKAVALDHIDLRFANRVVVKPINEVIR